MTQDIIERQNDSLRAGDTIYHDGDWAWGTKSNIHAYELLMKKMRDDVTRHLILGNHDTLKPFTYINLGFTSVHTSLKIKIEGVDAYLCHDPSVWTMIPEGAILVCGHVHGLFKTIPERLVINVGVDVWEYSPVNEDTILANLGFE